MATPTHIADPKDPRLEPFRAIRERDLVGRRGRYVAEGDVVMAMLRTAPRFLAGLETVLVSERVARAGRPWFEALPPEAAFLAAPDAIVEQTAGFDIHRGVLAIGRRPDDDARAALLARAPGRALVVVCVGLANHDNLGGVFRNAAAFGADAVFCDEACCDPLYRKAIRVSVGGVFRTPFARGGTAGEIVDDLEQAGFLPLALSPRGATALHEMPLPQRIALVLGPEGPGLPDELLSRLPTARIAMAEGFDSLNVAVSAGIALAQAFHR